MASGAGLSLVNCDTPRLTPAKRGTGYRNFLAFQESYISTEMKRTGKKKEIQMPYFSLPCDQSSPNPVTSYKLADPRIRAPPRESSLGREAWSQPGTSCL